MQVIDLKNGRYVAHYRQSNGSPGKVESDLEGLAHFFQTTTTKVLANLVPQATTNALVTNVPPGVRMFKPGHEPQHVFPQPVVCNEEPLLPVTLNYREDGEVESNIGQAQQADSGIEEPLLPVVMNYKPNKPAAKQAARPVAASDVEEPLTPVVMRY